MANTDLWPTQFTIQYTELMIRHMCRRETMNILTRARIMKMTGSEFVWIVCRTALPDPPSIFHDGMFGKTYPPASMAKSLRTVFVLFQ